jgi:hypothetical protein
MVLEATGIGNMDKLQLKIEIRHKSNWHNETIRAARRSKFMCALVLALRKIPIYAPGGGTETLGGPTNPGYSVAVPDSWATEAREKASAAKEAKRLVPTAARAPSMRSNKYDGTLGPVPEEAAASALNARRPTLDAGYDALVRTASANSRSDDVSRDESPGPKRSMDTSDPSLMTRKSTRGRRKRGDTAPTRSGPGAGPGPAFSITQPSPQPSPRPSQQQNYMSPRAADEEAEVGIHELSGRGRDDLDYETYRAQHAMGGAPPAAGPGYERYPEQEEQMYRQMEGQQLMPGGSAAAGSPETPMQRDQREQMRLQRLSLGLGNIDDREEGFL